jgi:hypothetical protein
MATEEEEKVGLGCLSDEDLAKWSRQTDANDNPTPEAYAAFAELARRSGLEGC